MPPKGFSNSSDDLAIYREIIEAAPLGIVLLATTPKYNVVVRNAAAIAVCGKGSGISLTARNFRFSDPKKEAWYRKALHRLAVDQIDTEAKTLVGAPESRLRVTIVPLKRRREVSFVAIFATPERSHPLPTVTALREDWGLTTAEAELVVALLETKSIRAAARKRGITIGTSRQYLKRIYNKMDVKSQTDLVLRLRLPPA